MNIQNRADFDKALQLLQASSIVVADTETNGLYPYQGNQMISLSVYLPEHEAAFNFPFRYGTGKVEISYTDKNTPETPFEAMSWQGNTKRQIYLDYWFTQFKQAVGESYFHNLPLAWLDELKAAWGRGTYIFHNARFDLHVLACEGFPQPDRVEDTMIALHIVNEDWAGIEVEAPFTWTKEDANRGLCRKEQVDLWARDSSGSLLKRKQQGNRRLKWQAALHGFANATNGEEKLQEEIGAFEMTLARFIFDHWDNPYNASLIYAGFAKKGENAEKQFDRIRAKITLDKKAHMWMLPSEAVTWYAELDVRLTWALYEKCMGIIREWNNEKLYQEQTDIHYRVAWEMERNGFRLDVGQAQAEIAKLDPRIVEIQAIIDRLAGGYCAGLTDREQDFVKRFEANSGVNLSSPVQLMAFLNSGILGIEYQDDVFPEWFEKERRGNLRTYPDAILTSTEHDQLEKYEDHPIVRLLLEYRKMKKSSDTYLKRWLWAKSPEGIVRFSMNDDGTVSGRFSSSGDAGNGQNIPDRGGYTIKRAIIPYSADWRFLAADYGQLELRIAAWIAEGLLGFDPKQTMTNLFLTDADMHSYVRDMVEVRQILFSDLTDEQIVVKLGYKLTDTEVATPEKRAEIVAKHCRQVAKTMNFGLLYSGTEYMLSKLLKIDLAPAKVLVKRWRAMFPAFGAAQAYFTELAQTRRPNPGQALAVGLPVLTELFPDLEELAVARSVHPKQARTMPMYVTQPISGRHRKLHLYPTWLTFYKDGKFQGFNPQEAESKKVWNNIVQGLGGYLCGMSALRINQKYGRDKLRFFAQIHDALDGFVHVQHMHIAQDIGTIMCDWPMITPPLTVDLQGSTDGTWQGMKSIKNFQTWVETQGKDGYK